MTEMGKRTVATMANQIEKLNNWLYRCLLRNQKRLETMGVESQVEETMAYLREWFPFDR